MFRRCEIRGAVSNFPVITARETGYRSGARCSRASRLQRFHLQGGEIMRVMITTALLFAMIAVAAADEVKFAAGPKFTKTAGGAYTVEFTLSAPADVEVAIVDGKGKVVRSLAAGVLGAKNPPPAPLKPGLSQSIDWDGKGDWNLPVGNGPFKARVRAGMGVKFGRTVGDSPNNYRDMLPAGLAVDPKNGDVYYMTRRGRDGNLVCLRVYDRTGKFIREIMPYPVGIDAKSRETFGSLALPGSKTPAPRIYDDLWPVMYPFLHGTEAGYVKLMAIHPTQPELVILDEYFGTLWRIRMSDGGAGSPFAEPLWEGRNGPLWGKRIGSVMGAIAPDGATMYFTGYCLAAPDKQKVNPTWPEGRVYKMVSGKDKAVKFVDVPLPAAWEAAEEAWGGPANGHQSLHGIAVDKSGNILVCDTSAGKVRIFSPDGKELGSIDAPGAYNCVPDLKSGALYVTTASMLYHRRAKLGVDSLVKFDSSKPGAKALITHTFNSNPDAWSAKIPIALDLSGPVPQIWVCYGGLTRIEERGGKFSVLENVDDRGKLASGSAIRIDVDPEAELVYVNNGWSRSEERRVGDE